MPSTTSAKQRLFVRLLALFVVAVVTYALQKGFEQDGEAWMSVSELLLYAVLLIVFLSKQTGRLKSRPDTGKVTGEQLMQEDPSASVYIGVYLFFLMILIITKAILDDPIQGMLITPWNIFIAAAPICAIVFWRQYKLEALRESE